MLPDVSICRQKAASAEELHPFQAHRLDAPVSISVDETNVLRGDGENSRLGQQTVHGECMAVALMPTIYPRNIHVHFHLKIKARQRLPRVMFGDGSSTVFACDEVATSLALEQVESKTC